MTECKHRFVWFREVWGVRTYSCAECEYEIDSWALDRIRELEATVLTLTRENDSMRSGGRHNNGDN